MGKILNRILQDPVILHSRLTPGKTYKILVLYIVCQDRTVCKPGNVKATEQKTFV